MSSEKPLRKKPKFIPSNPEGRPSGYKPEYCELIVKHMGEGNSIISFSFLVDAHVDTIYNWCKKHDEFFSAFKRAKAAEQLWYEKTGKNAMNGEIANFNSAVYIFHMKNKFQWTDRPQEIKVTHAIEQSKKLSEIDTSVIEGYLAGSDDDDE